MRENPRINEHIRGDIPVLQLYVGRLQAERGASSLRKEAEGEEDREQRREEEENERETMNE